MVKPDLVHDSRILLWILPTTETKLSMRITYSLTGHLDQARADL